MNTKPYKSIEIVTIRVSCELGDWIQAHVARRGTTKSATTRHHIMFDTQAKNCLANMVPGLPEATTIVHIPDTTPKGERLTREEWNQALWFACGKFGVPMWTQSSVKSLTFYFVPQSWFDKLASKWDRGADGPKFAVYAPLIFSEVDGDDPMTVELDRIDSAPDSKDGSCECDPRVWGNRTCQIRAMVQDEEGIPTSIAKGIVVPVKGTDLRLNKSQVKFGGAGKFTVLRNKYVGSSRITRMWVSCEPILMLQDESAVRAFLGGRVEAEVSKLLGLLTEERRPDLLKYLGSLRLDDSLELRASKRAVEDALRSKLPWCKEIEERVTRFAIQMICEKIAPSGAVEGEASVMVISNKHGIGPCEWDDAHVVAFRIPLTGANAIIPMRRSPYVRGRGMVVTAEVAKMASGDDDGDTLVVVSDPEVVELFRQFVNTEIVSGFKPTKTRAQGELTADFMADMAVNQVGMNWQVGALNVGGWKLIQVGDFKGASELLDLANVQPMTLKWDIRYDGKSFADVVSEKYGARRKQLSGDPEDPTKPGITLQWRSQAINSKKWKSPRELAHATIEQPASHLDCCWNAAVRAAQRWVESNPLKALSISQVARLTFGEQGVVLSGSDWREARELISWWGSYWANVRENGSMDGDHSTAFRHAHEWGKTASTGAIAALLVWRPSNPDSSGFSLKWHSVFAAGRGAEVLGLHPAVAEAIKGLRGLVADYQRQIALVEALLENIQ